MTTILRKPYLFIFLTFNWIFISPITEAAKSVKIDSKQANYFFLPHTLVHEFKSKTNGVRYNLYISLPKEYNFTKKHYPIIYLLDADYSFALAKQISEHLSDRNRIKESIIVGIAYANPNEYKKNRTRDYTPSYVPSGGYGKEYQKYSGGAEKFYQFIESELIPYFKQRYRIDDSTLVGHSFGGLFGAYLLIKHPSLFDNYIIVSPSLWYDNHLLLKMAQNKQHFNFEQAKGVWLMIGSQENQGDYRMVDDLKIFNTIIMAKSHRNFNVSVSIVNNLDHDTIFPMALTQGLMKLNHSNQTFLF
jgi:predicted alpha/beta superfamily hydrolase